MTLNAGFESIALVTSVHTAPQGLSTVQQFNSRHRAIGMTYGGTNYRFRPLVGEKSDGRPRSTTAGTNALREQSQNEPIMSDEHWLFNKFLESFKTSLHSCLSQH